MAALGLQGGAPAIVAATGILLAACGSGPGLERLPVSIPAESDWREVGPVLEPGPEGAWDRIFAGPSSPSSAIHREGLWWLYYVAADGPRDYDGGPRHRAVGLAISRDGVRFEKLDPAPVLSHRPTGGQEEGANSAAVALAADGSFVMHYGAATQFASDQIHADVRVARSADGRHFEDVGLALSHADPAVHGSGDELFPVASYRYAGNWYVFYVPNGSPQSRDLAVAWGPSELDLAQTRLVVDGTPDDPARCAANVILAGDRVIVFVQRGWKSRMRIEARVAPAASPWELGPPLRVWDGPLFRDETQFLNLALDSERSSWLLYRLDWNGRLVLHTAAVSGPPLTRGGVSSGVSAR